MVNAVAVGDLLPGGNVSLRDEYHLMDKFAHFLPGKDLVIMYAHPRPLVDPDCVGRARVVEHRYRGAGVERGADSHRLRPLRAVPLFKLDVMIMMRLIRLFNFIVLVTYLRNSLAVMLFHQQEVPRECCHEDLV